MKSVIFEACNKMRREIIVFPRNWHYKKQQKIILSKQYLSSFIWTKLEEFSFSKQSSIHSKASPKITNFTALVSYLTEEQTRGADKFLKS